MGMVLEWVGVRARWVLAVGVLAAFFMPGFSAMLRPWLSILVGLVFCAAMVRMDLRGMGARLVRPSHLAALLAWSVALMAVTPAVVWAGMSGLGLPEGYVAAVVYTTLAPPITSATALCLIIGLEAMFALELTIVASVVTPLIGPIMAKLLLGEAVPIDGISLGLRIAAMVLGGIVAAIVLRHLMGAERIERNRRKFDGVSAIVMWLVVVAVLDGAGARVVETPWLALGVFILAVIANFGLQVIAALSISVSGSPLAGAAGLMWGNRTVALYLAALPFDPVFALYVAFFQVPMLFTPLVTGGLLTWADRRRVALSG
ncbi:hypothetical protein KHP62_05545 [Rhodobacteraceae bacterium NNCM2]|nr:hypothetical protein [Coraliihabitans acroporae]